jgi:hypothetical protein
MRRLALLDTLLDLLWFILLLALGAALDQNSTGAVIATLCGMLGLWVIRRTALRFRIVSQPMFSTKERL